MALVKISFSRMADDNCTCETWVDEATARPYAVVGFPADGRYIPVTYDGANLNPISIGGGNVACFDKPEGARAFLMSYVARKRGGHLS